VRILKKKIKILIPTLLLLLASGFVYFKNAGTEEPVSTVSAAQVDYFLKIEGIEGESVVEGRVGEIAIQEFSWGEEEAGMEMVVANVGGGAGKPVFSDFNFQTRINKASPKLMEAVATGMNIPEVTLFGLRAGEQRQQFLIVKLKDVHVTSYQTGGSGSDLPMDSFSLNYSRIEFEYYPQNPDGTLESPVKAGWDLKKNEKI
jgi:type VI secretion system secreted protein Hcp